MKKVIFENIENMIQQRSNNYSPCIIRISDLDDFHPYDVMSAMDIMSVNLRKIEILELGIIEKSALIPVKEFSRNIDYYKVKFVPQISQDVSERGIRLEYDSLYHMISFDKDGNNYPFKKLYARQNIRNDELKGRQEIIFEYLYNRPNQIISHKELESIDSNFEGSRFDQYIASMLNFNENLWVEKFFPLLDARHGYMFTPFVAADQFDNYENIEITYQTKRNLK